MSYRYGIMAILLVIVAQPSVRGFSSTNSGSIVSSRISVTAVPKCSVAAMLDTRTAATTNQYYKSGGFRLNSHDDDSIDNGTQFTRGNGTHITRSTVLAMVGKSVILGAGIFAGSLAFSGAAFADEVGRNVDAPTLYTGEEIMICTKRGILGACTKTEKRTSENDNDKATKYFNDPELKFQEKYKASQLQAIEDKANGVPPAGSPEFDGNALIARLKEKSEENREKNDSIVRQKTLQNNLGANFGPFSSKVPILNADGVDYTLLDAPQAMRLKNAGYIDGNKKFITQPPQEAIDEALAASEDSGIAKANRAIQGALDNLYRL